MNTPTDQSRTERALPTVGVSITAEAKRRAVPVLRAVQAFPLICVSKGDQ